MNVYINLIRNYTPYIQLYTLLLYTLNVHKSIVQKKKQSFRLERKIIDKIFFFFFLFSP